MTSTTEILGPAAADSSPRGLRRLLLALRPGARISGGILSVAGLVLVWLPSLWAGALGMELLAAAFWCWARAAEDRKQQLGRWTWLRRPATALWLAAAAGLVSTEVASVGDGFVVASLTRLLLWVQALGVVWAGLELLAALPLARPFAERGGPLPGIGPWLPVMLPSTGFALLWRHVIHWTSVPEVRRAALLLLVLTAVLATLRAFSRQRWVASLRWLIVADGVLASALLALSVVPSEVSLMLWFAAAGGHAALLAGELRGMAPRRVAASHILWRMSGWLSIATLSWPLLVTLGFGPPGLRNRGFAIPTAIAVALATWVMIRRMVEAPERRAMVRRESAVSLSRLTAALTMVVGPLALVMAWWTGFEVPWHVAWLALAPALVPGVIAWWFERHPERIPTLAWPRGDVARAAATNLFRATVAIERRLVGLLAGLLRGLLAPSRDLHTGDAQEYLLFLVGISVLALIIPVLR
jgi:hypothetical protein